MITETKNDKKKRLVRPHHLYRDEDLRQNALMQFAEHGIPIPKIRQIGMFWLRWKGLGEMPPDMPYPSGPGWPPNSGKLEPFYSYDEWQSLGQHSHKTLSLAEALWVWMCENTCRAERGIEAHGLESTSAPGSITLWVELPEEVDWLTAR